MPPGLKAFFISEKNSFWNKLSAGPTGSDESVMITSNELTFSFKNLNPSSTTTDTFIMF